MKRKILLLILSIVSLCCGTHIAASQTLFESFQSPPAEAKPFVRWWWNGNNVVAEELHRQLDLLDRAGFGGYEINPIAMPTFSRVKPTTPALRWNSTEWNRIVVDLIEDTHERGMVADMLIGSGWPFGGPSITPENSVQGMMLTTIECASGDTIRETRESLFKRYIGDAKLRGGELKMADNYKIRYVRLVPKNLSSLDEVIDLTQMLERDSKIEYCVPQGEYILSFAIQQEALRSVAMGVIGSDGLSMDHFRSELVLDYLEQIKKLSTDSGIELSKLIRAIFCDSIELRGSNWTPQLESIFTKTYGYSLDPYLPYILYDPHKGYADSDSLPKGLEDQITRARYDYNQLVVDLFNENFTKSLSTFAAENGIKARYQAYGGPFLFGIIDGYMLTDIPESNSWLNTSFAPNGYADEFSWGQGHGCLVWNVCAATAARLNGRSIVSSEAMTNTTYSYQGSLADVKLHDDFNFITGINHSVLHGFNYSPEYAGFPGWVRFGEYFSEQNTWWPYINKWTEYNARLSAVFQAATPVKSIAVVVPEGDIWATFGLTRQLYQKEPWYCFRLWDAFSVNGAGCDYINDNILNDGKIGNGTFDYGDISYEALILASNESIASETAAKIEEYVKCGGKLIMIDKIPSRTLSGSKKEVGESANIAAIFASLQANYKDRVFFFESPTNQSHLPSWLNDVIIESDLPTDVRYSATATTIYQIRAHSDDKDIYFFANKSRVKESEVLATFPTGDKTPWIWNPESGERKPYPYRESKNRLHIKLKGGESLLIVFEPHMHAEPSPVEPVLVASPLDCGVWSVEFRHMNGEVSNQQMPTLTDIAALSGLEQFSGEILYKGSFEADGSERKILFSNIDRGISELIINGKSVGVSWYGQPEFDIAGRVKEGKNEIVIKHTTLTQNYAVAEDVHRVYKQIIPQGVSGSLFILK